MKVFVSWSLPRSKAVAEALAGWLPLVIQAVDPWISSEMTKGVRWTPELAKKLEESKVGISFRPSSRFQAAAPFGTAPPSVVADAWQRFDDQQPARECLDSFHP